MKPMRKVFPTCLQVVMTNLTRFSVKRQINCLQYLERWPCVAVFSTLRVRLQIDQRRSTSVNVLEKTRTLPYRHVGNHPLECVCLSGCTRNTARFRISFMCMAKKKCCPATSLLAHPNHTAPKVFPPYR